MQPILILTKNLLVEQRLQEQLQQLNYEVLSSVRVFRLLKKSKQKMPNFQVIIFSETITNKEIELVLPRIVQEKVIIIRKFSVAPSVEDQERLSDLGVSEWITEDISLDALRERLAEKIDQQQRAEQEEFLSPDHTSELTKTLMGHFLDGLTKREKMAFLYLQQADGETVSREDLCYHMWQEELSHSRMSQMSVIVKNIKTKLQKAGFNERILRTIWGNGYCLTPEYSVEFSKRVE
ncbi:winged helix-turn-helix domain-containing protein [Enterococcus sp. 669A]|uniref:Winged helix-turn-helix domain-containing protein n=1 Tax=Candidatus Enterococcus moelleringii TaxID=2815325 RepID=A0ABS3L8E0_9ENTE|nr:winged helix-turn-helix domain-containing protein [Enterococcus sp. 669A]MBO1305892.1 winged helix-turn-helix domain-containing protein [Enterococcus sp. 669A]